MSSPEPRVPRPGEPAPDFTLPAVHREGTVSLGDYRGRSPLLIAFFRGIYCPFCRRQIAKLGLAQDKLRAAGAETLAVVASNLDRTRLYFQYRPTRVPLAVDPVMNTHRAFGIRRFPVTPELTSALQTVRIDMGGELPQPLSVHDAAVALNDKDRFEYVPSDNQEIEQQFPMDTGQFLVDPEGIVRWIHLESAGEGLAGMGKVPSEDELLALARKYRA
jgi:peroxiredoxin